MGAAEPEPSRQFIRLTLLGGLLSACGGAVPMLQPAQPLAPSQVEAGAGVSSQVVLGRAGRDIDTARELDAVGDSTAINRQFIRGAVQHALQTPGLAPWVNARVGLEGNNEGAITYTGRSARIGVRHAWLFDDLAFSAGLGVASLWTQGAQSSEMDADGFSSDTLAWRAQGFGGDLPLTFGWTARADVLSLWVGGRLGFESLAGELPFTAAGVLTDAEADAVRWYAGGLAGLSVGISPLWVRLEIGVNYSRGEGRVVLPWADSGEETIEETVDGVALSPAGAIAVQF